MLGLSWPYRKVYTLDEVMRYKMRFRERGPWKDERTERIQARIWRAQMQHPFWRRVKVPVDKITSSWQRVACVHPDLTEYVDRRRRGSRFPPVFLERNTFPTGRPWTAIDGNHRVRAAQCVGDRTIDAFVPVKRAPRGT